MKKTNEKKKGGWNNKKALIIQRKQRSRQLKISKLAKQGQDLSSSLNHLLEEEVEAAEVILDSRVVEGAVGVTRIRTKCKGTRVATQEPSNPVSQH